MHAVNPRHAFFTVLVSLAGVATRGWSIWGTAVEPLAQPFVAQKAGINSGNIMSNIKVNGLPGRQLLFIHVGKGARRERHPPWRAFQRIRSCAREPRARAHAAGGKTVREFMNTMSIPYVESHRQLTPVPLIHLAASSKVVVSVRDPLDRAVSAFYSSWHRRPEEWQSCFPTVDRLAEALVDPASGASAACVRLAQQPFYTDDPADAQGHLGKGFTLYFNDRVLTTLEKTSDVYLVRTPRIDEDLPGLVQWLKGSRPGRTVRVPRGTATLGQLVTHQHNNSANHAAGEMAEHLAQPFAVHLAPEYHIVARLLCMSTNAFQVPAVFGRMQISACSPQPLAHFAPCNLSTACRTLAHDAVADCVVRAEPRAAWQTCPPEDANAEDGRHGSELLGD